MKKRILVRKIGLCVAAATALLWSCEDATDIIQDGELNPGAIYETVDDMRLALNGVYAVYNDQNEIRFTAPFTDEISRGVDNGGQGRDTYAYVLDPTSGFGNSFWASNYNTANEATRLIEGSELVERTDANGAEYDQILGQAFALRSIAHFNLIKFFGIDINDPSSTGVPNLDFIPVPNGSYPRLTVGDNITLIESDLSQAQDLLDGADLGVTFIDDQVLTAYEARLAVYLEDYTRAETAADAVISQVALANQSQYDALHNDIYEDDVEVIWTYDNTQSAGQGGSIGNLYNNVSSDIGGAPILEMSRNVFDKYEDDDIRKNIFVDPTSIISPDFQSESDPFNSDILVVNKYPGSNGFLLVNDIKLYRVSEMYLIKAEARINAGDLNGAAEAIAAVTRARRGDNTLPADSYGSPTQAWDAVLEARQLELWGEGHRYLDIKRLRDKSSITDLGRIDLECSFFNVGSNNCNLEVDNYRFDTLPIPIAELNGNDAIDQGDQNPGYN